ncbi:MAG: WD40 repeat domain-containing protein [Ilumatobacteraceae bacterium]
MTRTIPTLATLVLVTVAAVGCSGADAEPAVDGPATPSTTTNAPPASGGSSGATAPGPIVSSPSPRAAAGLAGETRWGDGRALAARADTSGRLVVATTIGVSVVSGEGGPRVLAEGLPSLLTVSPDGRTAAFTLGAELEVWDLDASAQVGSYEIADRRYSTLAFSSDADLVAGGEGDVTRYPVDGSAPEQLAAAPPGEVLGPVAVSVGGTVAIPIGGQTPHVVLWTPGGTVRPVELGLAADTQLAGVVWSADAARFAVLMQPPAASQMVAVWDVASGAFTGSVTIPNSLSPAQVAFLGSGDVVVPMPDQLAAIGPDGSVSATATIGSAEVAAVTALPASGAVVVTGYDGRLRRWTGAADPVEIAPGRFNVVDASVPTGSDDVLTVDHYGTISRFDASGEVGHDARFAAGEVNAVAVSADGSRLAAVASTGAVSVLDVAAGNVDQELDRSEGSVAAVAFSPAAPLLAVGLGVQVSDQVWNDAVTVTDLTDDRAVGGFGGEQENVAGCSFFLGKVAFSPDGALVAASSHDFTVQVLVVGSGDVRVLGAHDGTILDLAFAPDGATLATSSADGTVRLWDIPTMTERTQWEAAPGGYWSLAFTPDGSTLVTSDVEGTITLLDAATGAPRATLDGTTAQLGGVAVTPDGTRLVAASPDGSLGIWSLASGAVVGRLTGPTMDVTDVAVSSDGTMVVAGSLDGTVRSWRMPA